MMKRAVMLGLMLMGMAGAQYVCTTSKDGLTSSCTDYDRQRRDAAEQQRLNAAADNLRSTLAATPAARTPLAGPTTFSAPYLKLPGNVQPATVQQIPDGATLVVMFNYKATTVHLRGVQTFPVGTENAIRATSELTTIAPVSSSVYVELGSVHTNKDGSINAYVWQLGNLVNLAMVERGMALPALVAGDPYYAVISGGVDFGKRAQLGIWKGVSTP